MVQSDEDERLLPHHQSAYRSFHSTETAVYISIVRTIDSGKLCALVLLDLSAAFDIVDHPIMLQVLHDRFCVEDTALKWFESYLSDRTQTYQVKDQQSRPRTVDCSVPQGSVLGPQNSTPTPKIWQTSSTIIFWTITCMRTTLNLSSIQRLLTFRMPS